MAFDFLKRWFGGTGPHGQEGDVDFRRLNRVLGKWRMPEDRFIRPGVRMVLTVDLRDFFPTITQGRVIGMFRSLGLDLPNAKLLARLCCLNGRLPQGAPTSPAIANIICRKLDRRMAGLARSCNADYTRYADDLIFSGSSRVLGLLPAIRGIVQEESFELAEEKTRVRRSGSRQRILGLNVNTHVSVPRRVRRYIRAMVHNHSRATYRDPQIDAFLMGHIAFMKSAHPDQAGRLRRKLRRR
jgi:hypothetical protein